MSSGRAGSLPVRGCGEGRSRSACQTLTVVLAQLFFGEHSLACAGQHVARVMGDLLERQYLRVVEDGEQTAVVDLR